MGTVRVHMSTSLDGFVTGPDVSVEQPMGVGGERLHEWMFAASDATDIETAAEMFSTRTTGAVVMGRRTFDVGEQPWGEDGTFHLPCFVLTHRAAPTLVKGKTSFTFVTEGPERAVAVAQTAAGDWSVTETGIVFVTCEPDFDALDVYRFSDQRVARLGRLGFRIPGTFTQMTVSRDGRWALATEMVRFDSYLMLLDNFR